MGNESAVGKTLSHSPSFCLSNKSANLFKNGINRSTQIKSLGFELSYTLYQNNLTTYWSLVNSHRQIFSFRDKDYGLKLQVSNLSKKTIPLSN